MESRGARWLVSAACLFGLTGLPACAADPPTISAVLPNRGYPRQLLAVDGTTYQASVVWDVGEPTETELRYGFLGTSYFQIPEDASPGTHPVAIRNENGTSVRRVDVTVLAPSGDFPPPRIEDVSNFIHSGTGPIKIALMVTGANVDVDATVEVNGTVVPNSTRFGALPVDFMQDHVPATFGYPVYHYVQLLNVVENVDLGSTLEVSVTNTDGQSDSATYQVPDSLDEFDSDGDGLLDSWEADGFPAPSGATIDLQEMGADQWRKNVLVEVDWVAAAEPDPSIWETIEDAFADGPVINPNGRPGIDLILDRGQGEGLDEGGTVLPDHTVMDFDVTNGQSGYTSFYTYKEDPANFDPDRFPIFHYAIFGRARPGGSSGNGEVWGNDFMVTFVDFGWEWTQPFYQAGTFIHELGHNLGLTHGGLMGDPQAPEPWKPNYPSTMGYRYQMKGASRDCDLVPDDVHTFSEGMFARIDEANVDENIGICDGSPLDMNDDGSLTSGPMETGEDTDTEVHDDFDQWGNLRLHFGSAGWVND